MSSKSRLLATGALMGGENRPPAGGFLAAMMRPQGSRELRPGDPDYDRALSAVARAQAGGASEPHK